MQPRVASRWGSAARISSTGASRLSLQHLLPAREVRRCKRPAPDDSGAVDQDVEPAGLRHARLDQRAALAAIEEVSWSTSA